MISAHKIVFRGLSNEDFDLKTCLAFDSDSGETDSYLSREAVMSESYRGEFNRIHNFKYTEAFSPQFTLIKDDFSDFTLEEERKVLKWLTGSPNASFISVYYDDSETISWEALGGFTEISLYKLGNGRTVGIIATFESAMPYALSPLQSATISSGTKITINTDEPESVVYPRITVKQASDIVVSLDKAPDSNYSGLIPGTIYYHAGSNKYYWSSSKYIGGYKIEIRNATGVMKSDEDKTSEYNTYDSALLHVKEESATKLATLWNDLSAVKEGDWQNMQWNETSENVLVGNFYRSLTTSDTFNASTEYYIQTTLVNGSAVYKKWNSEYNIINNIEPGGTAYTKVSIATASVFNKRKNELYVKNIGAAHPQVTISMSVKTNVWYQATADEYAKNKPQIDTTSVQITNTYTDKNNKSQTHIMSIKNNKAGEQVVVDGANKVISSSSTNRIFGDDFTWNWLYLVNGSNTINATGNCSSITFEWRTPIKCSEF